MLRSCVWGVEEVGWGVGGDVCLRVVVWGQMMDVTGDLMVGHILRLNVSGKSMGTYYLRLPTLIGSLFPDVDSSPLEELDSLDDGL